MENDGLMLFLGKDPSRSATARFGYCKLAGRLVSAECAQHPANLAHFTIPGYKPQVPMDSVSAWPTSCHEGFRAGHGSPWATYPRFFSERITLFSALRIKGHTDCEHRQPVLGLPSGWSPAGPSDSRRSPAPSIERRR